MHHYNYAATGDMVSVSFRSKIILGSSIGSEQIIRYSELGGYPLLGSL
jgi:hypothetical protein